MKEREERWMIHGWSAVGRTGDACWWMNVSAMRRMRRKEEEIIGDKRREISVDELYPAPDDLLRVSEVLAQYSTFLTDAPPLFRLPP